MVEIYFFGQVAGPISAVSAIAILLFNQHMAALKERREAQRRYINESKTRAPSGDVIKGRLNELPPELEGADWSDDVDGSKEDVINAIKNLPS